jgi:hypothetical protein
MRSLQPKHVMKQLCNPTDFQFEKLHFAANTSCLREGHLQDLVREEAYRLTPASLPTTRCTPSDDVKMCSVSNKPLTRKSEQVPIIKRERRSHKHGARILANFEGTRRITGGMQKYIQLSELNGLRCGDQQVSRQATWNRAQAETNGFSSNHWWPCWNCRCS